MRHAKLWLGAAAAFAASVSGADIIISTFDSDAQGWVVAPGSAAAVTHMAAGGNPGGFLHIDPTDGADVAVIRAPAAFQGSLTRFNRGVFRWDGNTLQAEGADYIEYGHVLISSPHGNASADVVSGRPPSGQWTRFTCPLTAATFGVSEGQWMLILGHVTSITLNVEGIFGLEMQGVDNIGVETCRADFDGDGFVTGLDFDRFIEAFEGGLPSSDFDGDGFITGLDFDVYVHAFELGC